MILRITAVDSNNKKYQCCAQKKKSAIKKPKSDRADARSGLGRGAGADHLLFEVALKEVRDVDVVLLGLWCVWIEVVLSVRDALINDQLDWTLGL